MVLAVRSLEREEGGRQGEVGPEVEVSVTLPPLSVSIQAAVEVFQFLLP